MAQVKRLGVIAAVLVTALSLKAEFYATTRDGDGRWWAVSPAGERMMLFGVDHVRHMGWWCEKTGRKEYEENVLKKFGTREKWEAATLSRLRDWGFNLLGVGHDESLRHRGLAHTETLHFGDRFARSGNDERAICPNPNGIPSTAFPNVFHPEFATWCEREAERMCRPLANDMDLVGYFIDNELCWWGIGEPAEGLYNVVRQFPKGHSARKALEGVSSPREFLRLCARTYFEKATAAIRKHDKNHLILGCRFANLDGAADDCVWEESGKFNDVVSFNCYAWADIDRNEVMVNGLANAPTLKAAIGHVAAKAKKPLMITEWSFPALDVGLKCSNGAGQRFENQAQRAEASELFARTLLSIPEVIGYVYFMWPDQPKEGITRAFPENSNYGLVNAKDEEYPLLTAALKRVQRKVERTMFASKLICNNGAYYIDDGSGLRMEGAVGGELFSRVMWKDRLVGRFTTMLCVNDGGNKWIDAKKVVRIDKERGEFEIEGGEAKVRFSVVVAVNAVGDGRFFAKVKEIRNLGEQPLKVVSVFFREYPAFKPAPTDEPRADWVWKRVPAAKWIDATHSLEFGAKSSSPAVKRFWYFLLDGAPLPDAEFALDDDAPLKAGEIRKVGDKIWIEGFVRSPKMLLGIGAHLDGYDYELLDREVAMMKNAGFASVRINFNPRNLKRYGGWQRYDRVVNALVAAGIEPLPIFCGWPYDRADEKFLAFVREAVSRYRGKVAHWEVWNEENIEMFWQKVSAADYLDLLKNVRSEILKQDPDAKIVLGGLAGVPIPFVKELYRLGAKDCFEVMNVHPYCFPFPPEETLPKELGELRKAMEEADDGAKPIWITEIGWPTHRLGVSERTVWTNGLAVARPDLKQWRAIYASHAEDGTPLDEKFRGDLLRLLPTGSTLEVLTHTPLKARLAKGGVDLVILPFTGGYAEDTLDALWTFVRDGGTLSFSGGFPFCSKFRYLKSGDWGRLRETSDCWDAAFKRFHLGYTAFWLDKSLPEDTRFITSKRLQGGDRIVPIGKNLANSKLVGAVVVKYASELKGNFIIDGYWGIGYDSVEPISEEKQADYLVRAVKIAEQHGVQRFYPYVFRTPEQKQGWSEDFFGIVHGDLRPKPAYEKLQMLKR